MKLKMFGKKSVSSVLFYCTRIATYGYIVFLLFIVISLLTNNFIIINENEFQIEIPFTDSILKGDYDASTFMAIICFFIFYSVFFFLLSLIFKTFSGEKLFTEIAIKYLRWFTILNFILPGLYIIVGFLIQYKIDLEDIISGLLHIGLAIFAGFIATIFKMGFTLQEENELTI
ncbi:hypothetical protein [Aquimarina sp. SS2-1]|uniref:hypothetical protein n=1 Tax=Aquimarina besae TaxID=3342247 RepID=UPI003670EFC0